MSKKDKQSKQDKDPAFGQEVNVQLDAQRGIKGTIVDQDDESITLAVIDKDSQRVYDVQIMSHEIEAIWIERKQEGDVKV